MRVSDEALQRAVAKDVTTYLPTYDDIAADLIEARADLEALGRAASQLEADREYNAGLVVERDADIARLRAEVEHYRAVAERSTAERAEALATEAGTAYAEAATWRAQARDSAASERAAWDEVVRLRAALLDRAALAPAAPPHTGLLRDEPLHAGDLLLLPDGTCSLGCAECNGGRPGCEWCSERCAKHGKGASNG